MTTSPDSGISTRQLGAEKESDAIVFLCRQGYVLVQRNYLCRLGEVDLVMRDRNTLVFVEVRWRRHQNFGLPEETVSHRKQQKLIRCAAHYLQAHHLTQSANCRFDVLSICPARKAGSSQYRLIQNAFQA